MATLITSFEDAAVLDNYSGDTADYGIGTVGTPPDGSSNLVTGANFSSIYSLSGLGAYPSQGQTFEFYIRDENQNYAQNGSVAAHRFAMQDTNPEANCYEIGCNADKEAKYKIKVYDESGTNATLAASAADETALPYGSWYRVEVQWADDGTITATVFDETDTQIVQISATDTTYTSGGIGHRLASGTYTDYFRVTGGTSLALTSGVATVTSVGQAATAAPSPVAATAGVGSVTVGGLSSTVSTPSTDRVGHLPAVRTLTWDGTDREELTWRAPALRALVWDNPDIQTFTLDE